MKGAFELEMPDLFICINYLSYLFVYLTRRRFCNNSQEKIHSTFSASLTKCFWSYKENLLAIKFAKLRHIPVYKFECVCWSMSLPM
jgi:SPX domain protein involved in polyphosphate accumulation